MVQDGERAGPRVIVIVPCFEEARFLGAVLATMPAFVDEILVVDDGSTDGTADVARAASVQDPRISVFVHPTNCGVGAAIIHGYLQALARDGAETDAFVVMAGDGQMAPEDLAAVATPVLLDEADYVKGDRFRHGSRREMPRGRYLGGRVFSALTGWAVGAPISDSQCGFTAVSRRMAGRVPWGEVWTGFGYPNDLLGHLAVCGARVREVPVRAIYGDERSKLRLRHLPTIFRLAFDARARAARRGNRITKT